MSEDFFTFSEYIKKSSEQLTPSMEDYLEMIFRLTKDTGFTRINDLSEILHVQPPSVTRMIQKLAELGLVDYEKYGVVKLTKSGSQQGSILLNRHMVIEAFLKFIGVTDSLFEDTEKIEHTISKEALVCIINFLAFLQENSEIATLYSNYKKHMENSQK